MAPLNQPKLNVTLAGTAFLVETPDSTCMAASKASLAATLWCGQVLVLELRAFRQLTASRSAVQERASASRIIEGAKSSYSHPDHNAHATTTKLTNFCEGED
jgi:hypothetical protein